MRWLDVYGCEPSFCLHHHLPPTFDLQKNLLTFSLSFRRQSSCLSCTNLFEFLFAFTPIPLFFEQLCVSFICSYFWSCSCCSHSCYSSKLTFLILSKLAFLMLFFKVIHCFSPFWCCCSFKIDPLLALLLLLDQAPSLPPFSIRI
jgi:hypothetical protein